MSRRIAFVLEQALGHVTHGRNLQQNIPMFVEPGRDGFEPVWLPVPYEVNGLAARLPVYRSNWSVRSGLRARAALRTARNAGRLDGIFFHTQVPAVLCADWIAGTPSVISLDATPIQYDQLGDYYNHQPGPAWFEEFKRRRNIAIFTSARKLVAWTAWTRASLVADYGVPADKVAVIPPGVNPGLWANRTLHNPQTKGPVRILFVGGDLARKGGDLLLEAYRSLAAARPGLALELHLVTKTKVEAGGGVFVYADYGPNDTRLIALYHACDMFALPTSGDCLPMVLSEAGAAGLPAISTTVAGIPEVISAGETGLLIPPRDGPALRAALEQLASDPALRRRMGLAAVDMISQRFDAVKNTAKLVELLLDATANPERGPNA